jgi:secondary thiamine-phosphate synthase enzyme
MSQKASSHPQIRLRRALQRLPPQGGRAQCHRERLSSSTSPSPRRPGQGQRHRDGLAVVSSLHTTLALFINEFQGALLDDIRTFLEESVVRDRYYKHNDPAHSDCDRSNADAHLRAMLLGHSLALPVRDGELLLGTYQSVILAELDGPPDRSLQLQILGT